MCKADKEQLPSNPSLHLMLLSASQHSSYCANHRSQQKVQTSDEMEWVEQGHWWTHLKESSGEMKRRWCNLLVFTGKDFQGLLYSINGNQLAHIRIYTVCVYQKSIYLNKGEIGKAICSPCSKVSCVMQLAMTTKLMVLWSRSQWVCNRPDAWIKFNTCCPAIFSEWELLPRSISQSQRVAGIRYVS